MLMGPFCKLSNSVLEKRSSPIKLRAIFIAANSSKPKNSKWKTDN